MLYSALTPAGQSTTASPAEKAAGSDAAGEFTAYTLAGRTVSVHGTRPSVLFFFSVGCGTCGPGAQALAQARQTAPEANYVAVDVALNAGLPQVMGTRFRELGR